MRTPQGIYFAEGLRFKDIKFENPQSLALAISERFYSYYIEPVKELIKNNKPFAAGLICISMIDSLSEYMSHSDKHERFTEWCKANIDDFGQEDQLREGKTLADSFYDFFRHGLVHHSRVNCGGQISIESDGCFRVIGNTYVLNPDFLINRLEEVLKIYLEEITSNEAEFNWIREFLCRVFKKDIKNDNDWQ